MMKKIAKKVGTKLFLGRKIGSKSYTRRRKLNKKRKSFVSLGWFEAFAHSVFSVVRSAFCQICAFPCFGHRFFYFIPVTCGSILPALLLDFFGCRTDIKLPFLLIASISFCLLPFELCPLSRSARWGDFRVSPFRFDLLPFDFLFAVFCCVL